MRATANNEARSNTAFHRLSTNSETSVLYNSSQPSSVHQTPELKKEEEERVIKNLKQRYGKEIKSLQKTFTHLTI